MARKGPTPPKFETSKKIKSDPKKTRVFERPFKWWHGPIEQRGNIYFQPKRPPLVYIYPPKGSPKKKVPASHPKSLGHIYRPLGPTQYTLTDEMGMNAFAELAECIESPLLCYSEVKRPSFHEDPEKGSNDKNRYCKREWLYHLYPQNYSDFPKVKKWIEKYGFPSLVTSLPAAGRNASPPPPGAMSIDDILTIANLVSLAWRLYQLGKSKEGKVEIKNFRTTFKLNDDLMLVTFGLGNENNLDYDNIVRTPYPEDLMIQLGGKKEILNPETWPNETWKKIAYLWLGRMCYYFIDTEMEARFADDIRIYPVIKAKSFLSWLWLVFFTRIGKGSESLSVKVCNCGREYSTHASFCPKCVADRKKAQKLAWWHENKDELPKGKKTRTVDKKIPGNASRKESEAQ